MPKKNLSAAAVPTLVQERLRIWGMAIRKQRLMQKLRVADLCRRMGISEATLRRLEQGDAGAGAGLYLIAFHILGLFEDAAPEPPSALWQHDSGQRRVRLSTKEHADDYF
ncbi:helix-turn-helix domain-containing protein [Noviherbaspirillum autotrophicum]|uniref:HTH cro/C1-type domain-containing protein n=1 Tax=Noviherbaspirillum autotrophicum TaxID=709839 RepID=A0A0C1XZ48_9BURK|nr:helix-turn-helix transcriptional regulator [Noviherbaspirillum autotrophicum]KIF80048.1 hypothetical protein TSA66_03225 [Noviherbaspirillum autotrophicum]